MPYALFDHLDAQLRNEVRIWAQALQKRERIKFDKKLDLLQQHGMSLLPNLLAGPVDTHIYKLRFGVDRLLRPRLCRGPINNETEFTLLLGAFEVGGNDKPPDANSQAVERRAAILADVRRRCPHERFDG
jgi:hypothetical protein